MTAAVAVRELPQEMHGCWVWPATTPKGRTQPRMPVGCLINHGNHVQLVLWVRVEGAAPEPAVVDSLTPLTIAHPVSCVTCGLTGRIVNDRWEPC